MVSPSSPEAITRPSPLASRGACPILRRAGGKGWLLKEILPRLPKGDCFVEPFAGGLAVLLAREPSHSEVCNDTDREVITFYRVAARHPEALIQELLWLPRIHEEFRLTAQWHRTAPDVLESMTEIQRVARWFHGISWSFGSINLGRGFGRVKSQGGSGALLG